MTSCAGPKHVVKATPLELELRRLAHEMATKGPKNWSPDLMNRMASCMLAYEEQQQ